MSKTKRRRDVFCYDCKKYYKDVDTSCCPDCKSEDTDVYPEAQFYNRDIEKTLLHKEAWLTTERCEQCGRDMIYRDDGYEKMFICRNTRCNFTKVPGQIKNLDKVKTKRLFIV